MGSVQAFRVGDVSVTPGANSARALRDAAERLAAQTQKFAVMRREDERTGASTQNIYMPVQRV